MTWWQVLRLWEWRWEVVLPLAVLGYLYFRGWKGLRQRGSRQSASPRRLAAYWTGLFLIFLALVSPIAPLSQYLFSVHMVQHMLLIMFAPPLLWLANPMPVFLWALPRPQRRHWGLGIFGPQAAFRRYLKALTTRKIAWMAFIAIYIGWHDPNLYSLALAYPRLHDVQHLTYFAAAMLYWWHVTNAGPRIHGRFSFPSRLVYLLSAVPVNMVTGLAIAFAKVPMYAYYRTVPRYFSLSVLDDQRLAGMVMWIFGNMMLIYAALVFVARYISQEERKTARHPYHLGTEARMRAPGWEESGSS